MVRARSRSWERSAAGAATTNAKQMAGRMRMALRLIVALWRMSRSKIQSDKYGSCYFARCVGAAGEKRAPDPVGGKDGESYPARVDPLGRRVADRVRGVV